MGNRDYLPDSGSRFSEILEQVTLGIVPERVFANSTSVTILFTILNINAPRTELLYADQVRDVHFSSIGMPCILRDFKILEYIQYSIA